MQTVLEQGSIDKPLTFDVGLIQLSFIPICSLNTCTGVLKISLAGANNSVPTTGLTPCIIIIHVYTCNYSGARKNIDAR